MGAFVLRATTGGSTVRGPDRLREVSGTTFFITLAAVAIGVVALSKVPTFVKTLAATAIGVAVMARVLFLPEPIAHGATVAVIVDPIKRVDDLPDLIVADVKSTRTQH